MAEDRRTIALNAAKRWSQEPFDAETRREVQALLDAGDMDAVELRFGDSLHFGTAGLRGVMGAGTAMMNRYTVAKASRALAVCLLEEYAKENAAERGVVIGFDTRYNSDIFARITAGVLAAAGIKVYLLDRLTPTPVVPYALLKLNAFAGVMVTSSHNPKKYNGYKVYWSNGAQIISPVDAQVASRMDVLPDIGIDEISVEDGIKSGRITILSDEMLNDYTDWVVRTSTFTHETDVDVVYTPLGGTGWEMASKSFAKAGFKKISVVEEEKDPGPEFAGLDAPNPERLDTWPRALAKAKAVHAEIVLANDGDADRLGVAIPVGDDYKILGGNEIGALILYYILSQMPKDQLNKEHFAICSVVSSPLTAAICKGFGIDFQETLTGFKWMGNVADARVKKGEKFVFAYEEAFGFTFGTSRDKDGIIAVVLLAELAAHCKAVGQKVSDVLDEIYRRFGMHIEGAAERFYEGATGPATMAQLLNNLRNDPPKQIAGIEVETVRDLKSLTTTNLISGEKFPVTHLPTQDMLTFKLVDKSWISIRPSGTEPKIKAYLGVIKDTSSEKYGEDRAALLKKLDDLKLAVKKML